MSLKLNSSGGGSVTLQEPTTASNRTLNLPDVNGTVVAADASGNVGIGTSSPSGKLNVQDSVAAGRANITLLNNAAGNTSNRMRIRMAASSGFSGTDLYPYIEAYEENAGNAAEGLAFGTYNGSSLGERARITSLGWFKASPDGVYPQAASGYHEFANTAQDLVMQVSSKSATSPFGVDIVYTAASPNGTTNRFLGCYDGGGTTQRAVIRSNGGIANFSANNVNLSDRREKTNFAPAGEWLSKICAIPVQTFNYIDQNMEEDPGATLGVVAQDVEAVAPELVMESNWGTEENPKMRLSIYQTDLQYALMKCIQEQQAMIEELKARVASLEGV